MSAPLVCDRIGWLKLRLHYQPHQHQFKSSSLIGYAHIRYPTADVSEGVKLWLLKSMDEFSLFPRVEQVSPHCDSKAQCKRRRVSFWLVSILSVSILSVSILSVSILSVSILSVSILSVSILSVSSECWHTHEKSKSIILTGLSLNPHRKMTTSRKCSSWHWSFSNCCCSCSGRLHM